MNIIIKILKEWWLMLAIIVSFAIYYLDAFNDGMLMSGFLVILILVYIALIWSEKVQDERDEHIRARTGRILYIVTIFALLIDIIYKTFAHENYVSSVTILTLLALVKVLANKYFKTNH